MRSFHPRKDYAFPCWIEVRFESRDWTLADFAEQAVARLEVSLATGETNDIQRITRSVIPNDKREQALSTEVRDNGRAFGQLSGNASHSAYTHTQQ